ncbi:hypothetical protein K0M31_007339, partial [Melipona bicolor]
DGNSNKSQVTLRDVDFALSGTFSCEVTADAPTFSTAYVSKNLTVVSLPEGTPIIVSERERYDAGDTLRANCSLPPSKPPAHLSFTLNNVAAEEDLSTETPAGRRDADADADTDTDTDTAERNASRVRQGREDQGMATY